MTEEQITALEELTGLYIFRLVELSCSVPSVRIEPGVNPLGSEERDGFSDLKVQSVAVQSCFTEKLSQ